MSFLTACSEDEFRPVGGLRPPLDVDLKFDWFLKLARQAVEHFPDKQTYNAWCLQTFCYDKNRFTASVCWDIVKLQEGANHD